MNAGTRARELFGGHFCAEAVLQALAERLGVESAAIPGIATGFCSGISRTNGPCGALTGAIMGLGLALGRSEPADSDESRMELGHCYAAVSRLTARFEAEFGSSTCTGLTGCDFSCPGELARFREEKRIERCYDFVEAAAGMAEAVIAEQVRKEEPQAKGETLL